MHLPLHALQAQQEQQAPPNIFHLLQSALQNSGKIYLDSGSQERVLAYPWCKQLIHIRETQLLRSYSTNSCTNDLPPPKHPCSSSGRFALVAGGEGSHQQAKDEERLRACLVLDVVLHRVLQEVLELQDHLGNC